jgi:hypothetical protein
MDAILEDIVLGDTDRERELLEKLFIFDKWVKFGEVQ